MKTEDEKDNSLPRKEWEAWLAENHKEIPMTQVEYDEFTKEGRALKKAHALAVFSLVCSAIAIAFAVASVSFKLGATYGCKQEKIPGTVIELDIDKDFWL